MTHLVQLKNLIVANLNHQLQQNKTRLKCILQLITVCWQLIVTIKNGNAVFSHFFWKPFPVLYKNFGVKWKIFHALIFIWVDNKDWIAIYIFIVFYYVVIVESGWQQLNYLIALNESIISTILIISKNYPNQQYQN